MGYKIEFIGEGEISLFKVGKMKKGIILPCKKDVALEFSDSPLFKVTGLVETVAEEEEI